MNMYIISSPLQMLCSIESFLNFKKEKNLFYVFLGKSEKNNDFMKDLSKKYLPKEQIYFFEQKTNSVIILINKINKIKNINKNYKINNLFIGNISEFSEKVFAINIECNRLWSLDDGSKTLVLKDYYSKSNNKINCFEKINLNSLVKSIILIFFSLKSSKVRVINWFTIFNFIPKNGGFIKNHQLLKFKKEINFKYHKSYNENDEVYFIGTNIINVGVIKNENYFIQLLSSIKNNYKNKKVYYIPHRFESSIHLKKISQLGFEIKEFDHIIEIAFLEKNIYPKTIASFYSTALYTLSKIFPETNVDFYEIDESYLAPKFILGTKIVEKEYKSIFGSVKY